MKLYHGSDVEIDSIDFTKCKPNKDFGKGFYLSESREQARAIANNRVRFSRKSPVINVFEFDESVLNSGELDVKIFREYNAEWADFVLKNRKGERVDQFDIVYGPIADDQVGLQIFLFTEGYIQREQFLERLKYHKGITFQYYFGSEKAISYLKKLSYECE